MGVPARYDFPIWPDPTNNEGRHVYDPISMTGCGYDANGERRRSVTATEAVWRDWVLSISISDTMRNNVCERCDSELVIRFSVIRINPGGDF